MSVEYSNRSVVIRYPCRFCGSNRPEKVVFDPSGGVRIEIGQCCPHRRKASTSLSTVAYRRYDTED